ncbi:MAG: hypothetical protein KGL53_08920, partial [Elusimicrobia bacterium]|nr:hypothetical protein [Elusimicrobiota bacterium]
LRRFFEPLLAVLREASQSLSRAETARAAAAEPASAPEPGPGSGSDASPERARPFSFIKETDLPALEMLLAARPELDVAIVVQYLAPALASRVLSSLSSQKRERVLSYMCRPALLNEASVKALEETLQSKIDLLIGGEEKLAALLDQAPASMREEILDAVRRRDPELGRRLSRRVVVLDDIGLLDEGALTILSRRAGVRCLAAVLKGSPRLSEEVLSKLKGGLGEWLSQEMALIGDQSGPAKEADERRALQSLVALVREGKVVLRKDSGEPAPETESDSLPAAPPPGLPVGGQ